MSDFKSIISPSDSSDESVTSDNAVNKSKSSDRIKIHSSVKLYLDVSPVIKELISSSSRPNSPTVQINILNLSEVNNPKRARRELIKSSFFRSTENN